MEYYFDDMEESISEMEDVDLTFFIYKKKLACIRAEIQEEEAELRFLGGDTRMQKYAVYDRRGGNAQD